MKELIPFMMACIVAVTIIAFCAVGYPWVGVFYGICGGWATYAVKESLSE